MNAVRNIIYHVKKLSHQSRESFYPCYNPTVLPSKIVAACLGILLVSGSTSIPGNPSDFSSCFIPGEMTQYKVSWMGIPLAWSRNTTDTVEENGRKLIRITMVSKNYKAYSYIYTVDNITEVIIDPETALPLRLDVVVNEGTIHKSHLATFDHEKKTAIFQDRISKDIREVPIQSGTQDIISFLYSARCQGMDSLTNETHKLFVEGKLYDLDLKIHKEGRISLAEHGAVESFQIEPVAEFDGLFLRKGKIFFWVSKAQQHRMVTCVEAKVAVGRIKVKLQAASGTGNDFWDKMEQGKINE